MDLNFPKPKDPDPNSIVLCNGDNRTGHVLDEPQQPSLDLGVGSAQSSSSSSSTLASFVNNSNNTNNGTTNSTCTHPEILNGPTKPTSSTSSTIIDENEDEHCVYTYKGGSNRSLADLPASFFEFDSSLEWTGTNTNNNNSCGSNNGSTGSSIGTCNNPSSSSSNLSNSTAAMSSSSAGSSAALSNGYHLGRSGASPENMHQQNNNNLYSPDMDFLEMDFDPGLPGDDDEIMEEATDDGATGSRNLYNFSDTSTATRLATSTAAAPTSKTSPEDIAIDSTDSAVPNSSRFAMLSRPGGPEPSTSVSTSNTVPETYQQQQQSPQVTPASASTSSRNSAQVESPTSSSFRNEPGSSRSILPAASTPPSGSATTSSGSAIRPQQPTISSSSPISSSSQSQSQSQRVPPQLNLSSRLVKSNTLPKMGSNSTPTLAACFNISPTAGGTSTAVTTPSSSSSAKSVGSGIHHGNFTPTLRTTGLSYSVPLMDTDHQKLQEHYKAVLLTKMPVSFVLYLVCPLIHCD